MLLFNVLLNCTVCRYCNIVILGKILRSVRQKLIVISGISLYRRSLYRGSVPYNLLQLLLGHSIFIVIPGISLYQGSLYWGSTVIKNIPQAPMGSESIAHEHKGQMDLAIDSEAMRAI